MLQRLAELVKMESTEKSHILHVLDGFFNPSTSFRTIQSLKISLRYKIEKPHNN
ncbi:MAG: hypothetical protein KBF35_02040 [Saprospiraceae bacterium]|nr:hypothetical protein [Saprospiraceae bacterium]